ncbi:VIT family protein [Ponticaulis sp.]|uniref:VIT1/CCC1 transporter family protein n=1 Tax=Ponticaulis sp. TaxID=2020902 RepID=UPI000B6CFD51|nr:VIT family protein [Ponticaulis sp.]MAI89803.1 nodulin 21 [Ponticaulis sp.]OUX99480.1 MAG: nodulin 21 [Hyphomonadaceae bacterium TMED5]|tara:strand:+ start:39219 stop:39926 length:708 start_codon:yes stop_codon:yes gene_type:complete
MIESEDHTEHHAVQRMGWLRASVLGANDGLISVASLIVGVASAAQPPGIILLTGISALAAGALSMAAGEYVSVASQADLEAADLAMEKAALEDDPEGELRELTAIYRERGLKPDLARQVAEALTEHDALEAHTRDELGFMDVHQARPVQAALASAGSFVAGGILPVLAALFSPAGLASELVGASTLLGLILIGYLSARAGGANPLRSIVRLVSLGVGAMLATSLLGALAGGLQLH